MAKQKQYPTHLVRMIMMMRLGALPIIHTLCGDLRHGLRDRIS
jgi:hypothetical protein